MAIYESFIKSVASEYGIAAAHALMKRYGGTSIHVPKAANMTPSHPIAVVTSFPTALAISERWGAEQVYVASARSVLIREAVLCGAAEDELSREFSVTARTAQRWIRKYRSAHDQN